MMSCRCLCVLSLLAFLLEVSVALQWTSSGTLPNGTTITVNSGQDVTLAWSFALDTAEHVLNTEWHFTGEGQSDVVIATDVRGNFLSAPATPQHVQQTSGGGIRLNNVAIADSGTYSIHVNVNLHGSIVTEVQAVQLVVVSGTSTSSSGSQGHRLPTNVRPLFYDLELKPDFYGNDPSAFTFSGSVSIHMECVSATNEIVLNSKNLSIMTSQVRVTDIDADVNIEVTRVDLDDDAELMYIRLKVDLKEGKSYKADITFTGPLTDDLAGLYLSSYQRGNETVYMATTQFEAPDAREAFPCFDEPNIKAHFNVTLLRRPPFLSLSNTQIKRTEDRGNGWLADVYETTPKMSTYLLAFVVCDFKVLRGTTDKNVEFQLWAREELSSQTAYALEIGMKIIDYYGTFFGTDFPLKKQGMVAIPDFANGAMENWGLITYRESYVTYQEGVTSEKDKQFVALVIAHELAHQWFGNLVTLAWWDDLWLNEGFAEFVEYIGMDLVGPSWKVWDQFSVDALQYSFALDQLVTSHPLYTVVRTVAEMEQYFDNISYEKGASVIRMIEFVMGRATFQRGLQRYLAAHSYANANHTDLWKSLAEQAQAETKNLNVPEIMDTWTLQMGFPVVKVTRADSGVTVTQKRFLINPDAKDPGVFQSPFGYMWHVPLTLVSSTEPNFNVTDKDVLWLGKTETQKTLSPTIQLAGRDDPDGWILANAQQYGYYRVNYDRQNWDALINQLKTDHTVIPPINRGQIIDDAWNLANAGETDIDVALGTLDYMAAETDYVPWKVTAIQLADLRMRMADTSGYGALSRFIQDRTRPLFRHLGLDDTNATALESYTRTSVVGLACASGLPECVEEAVRLFRQWQQDPDINPISPAVRYRVYCTALQAGGEADWYFALSRYRQETSPSEQDLLREALACTKHLWILSTYLDMALEGGDIRRDEATGVIAWVARNPAGHDLAWDFMRTHWDTIMTDYSQSASRLKGMVSSVASRFHEDYELQELKDFIASLPELGKAKQALSQAVETVEYNRKWHSNSYPRVVQWLEAKGYNQFEGTERVTKSVTKEDILLPTDLLPLHYDLNIEPNMYDGDPDNFTFNGTLTMIFHCIKATDQVVLHAHELKVDNFHLVGTETRSAPGVASSRVDVEKQFLVILLDAELSTGHNYSISMDFQGPLDRDLNGMYLSSYTDGNRTAYLATTKFEPVAARKAFPCMDEPSLKATYSTTIVRRTWNTALSNMPVARSVDLGDDRVADEFQTSLPMSTYLVALIVCDFTHKTRYTTTNHIKYEVWGRPDARDQLDFALDLGVKVIDYYENYFGVEFPLPKQSMIAIPDFASGAMENWGLITYRETRLYIEEGVSSWGNKASTSMTIAHELAHMWFGDLVSPVWWDDIWLNEGFARYMQYLGVDYVHPDWKEWDIFVTTVLQRGLEMDGFVSSHPIYVPVATPEQISEVFDSISYDKGASIIRMIRHALGQDTFAKGITNYLNNLRYGNADHTDLWKALNDQAARDGKSVNVGDVMDTWTLQMNYPVVMVTRHGQTLTLTQQRFLKDPTAEDPGKYGSPFGYTWDIPFTYTTSGQPNFDETTADITWVLRTDLSGTLRLPDDLPADGWVLGNLKEVGYYRVNYDNDNWQRLAQQLGSDPTIIDPVNRAQIIDDAWNLASGGYLDQSIALSVVEYLDKEQDYVPWEAASVQFGFVITMLSTTELYGPFKEFLADKTKTQYNSLGMNNTNAPFQQSFLRTIIAGMACSSRVAGCLQTAQDLFRQWKNDPTTNPISPELRSTVYCTALRHGSTEDWDFLYERFLTEANVNEKTRQLYSLACSEELWVLSRLLDRAMYSGDIRSQDVLTVVRLVLRNAVGRSLAWRFIRDKWDTIFERFSDQPFPMKSLVTELGNAFNSRTELQEMQSFVASNPDLGTVERAFQASVEKIRSNIRWMDNNFSTIKHWLTALGYYRP